MPIDQFIMFCAGSWMTAVGFGYLNIPGQSHAQPQAWTIQLTRHFRWMGPLLMVLAIALLFAPHAGVETAAMGRSVISNVRL